MNTYETLMTCINLISDQIAELAFKMEEIDMENELAGGCVTHTCCPWGCPNYARCKDFESLLSQKYKLYDVYELMCEKAKEVKPQ